MKDRIKLLREFIELYDNKELIERNLNYDRSVFWKRDIDGVVRFTDEGREVVEKLLDLRELEEGVVEYLLEENTYEVDKIIRNIKILLREYALKKLGFEIFSNGEVLVSGSNELDVFKVFNRLIAVEDYFIQELGASSITIGAVYLDVDCDCMKTKIEVEWN